MASSLPTPVRIAAGLVGTVADRVSTLPQDLPNLGVSLVGQAFRLSLKARQQVAQLAVRGDELLSGLRSGPPAQPAWATFDEDIDAADDTPVDAAWADLAELSVSQLRDRLDGAEAADVRAALAAEETGRHRPAHLTLLHNRLTALTEQ